MTAIAKGLISLSTLLLVCCTGKPPHPDGSVSMPQSTRSGTRYIQDAHDLSQLKWWQQLHDPVLTNLITTALAHNNQILSAQANVLQTQAKLKAAQFAWLPTLNATGSGFSGKTFDNEITPQGALASTPLFSQQGNMHFKGYYTGFVPGYSLNLMQNINADKLAKASLAIQEATYNSTRLSIISQVSGSYFMLLGHQAQKKIQTQLIHDLEKSRQLEHERYHEGANDLTMVAQLDKQLANAKAQLDITINSINQVENALHVLINQNPGALNTHQSIEKLRLNGIIPANLPSSVLKNRPDMIVAIENLKSTDANLGLAYAQFFPSISLTGLLGGASVDLSHLLSLSTGIWVTQVAGSLPILNGPAYEQINAAKASSKAAYYQYVQTVRSIFADVDNQLTNYQQMRHAYKQQDDALKASRTGYQLAMARYKTGAKDYRDVINAKLNFDYAKSDLVLAKMQLLDSIVQVYQAVAGGYKS